MEEFIKFDKIARLSRNCVITEKIDGTNAQIFINEDGEILAGSRNRWITPENDNYGFAKWVMKHKEDLLTLGAGHHYGEWWGSGIQRKYGIDEKRFSLFNVGLWNEENIPKCCNVVPIILKGTFSSKLVNLCLNTLKESGSFAAPGFMNPEGIIIWHEAAQIYFKKTIKGDEKPKNSREV